MKQLKEEKVFSGGFDTLLIVDDDEINRGILDNLFSAFFPVEEAADGQEGLKKILERPGKYCAVLLDVVMPRMDGLEVLRRLKEEELLRRSGRPGAGGDPRMRPRCPPCIAPWLRTSIVPATGGRGRGCLRWPPTWGLWRGGFAGRLSG